MRLAKLSLTGALCILVLTTFGCSQQNERITALEQDNTKLQAERDDVALRLAATQEIVKKVQQNATANNDQINTMRSCLDEHIIKLAQTTAWQRTFEKTLQLVNTRLDDAASQQGSGYEQARQAAVQAEKAVDEAQKRIAELERKVAEMARTLADAEKKAAQPPTPKPLATP